MKTFLQSILKLNSLWTLICMLFLAGPVFSLPYRDLGDSNLPNGWALRLSDNGVRVGSVDYVSDVPNGHTGADRGLGTRITYQFALPTIAADPYVEALPVVMVFHGNGGNSGSLCISWRDHNNQTIVERRNESGSEYVLVAVDGHPPIPQDINDKSGNWHYHYSEYNFDEPADDDASNDVHRVDHLQGIENIIARLDNDPTMNIDINRIYIVGFSGGGLMTHRLAMEGIGTYHFTASATIEAALGGIKNQETFAPQDLTWDLNHGGFPLGMTALTFTDCETDTDCTPIPSSQLIYPIDNGIAVPTLIQLGDGDVHFPVDGGEDLERFKMAADASQDLGEVDSSANGNRTGISTLTETTIGYRLKNSTTNNVLDCPLVRTVNQSNGTDGFIMSEYNDSSSGCNAVIKVVEMDGWGHAIAKPSTDTMYDSLDRTLQFFDSYGVDPIGGTGGGLGQ